jgi:hypothetical protein
MGAQKTLRGELDAFGLVLTDQKRRRRLIGKEIDAALSDPRWVASESIDSKS